MANRPIEYVVKVSKLWCGHISGPILAIVSICLVIAASIFANDPSQSASVLKWSARLTISATILVVFIAQYDAWLVERMHAEAETAKNRSPEIEGEAHGFEPRGGSSELMGNNGPFRARQFSFRLSLVNRRQVDTNVLKVMIDGSKTVPPIKISGLVHALQIEVCYAKGTTVILNGTAEIAGRSDCEETVILDELKIIVIDGFRASHQIDTLKGESLTFPANHLGVSESVSSEL